MTSKSCIFSNGEKKWSSISKALPDTVKLQNLTNLRDPLASKKLFRPLLSDLTPLSGKTLFSSCYPVISNYSSLVNLPIKAVKK